jgi:RNA polymerase-interacting CarD/CdnL/TRCF family regulator
VDQIAICLERVAVHVLKSQLSLQEQGENQLKCRPRVRIDLETIVDQSIVSAGNIVRDLWQPSGQHSVSDRLER